MLEVVDGDVLRLLLGCVVVTVEKVYVRCVCGVVDGVAGPVLRVRAPRLQRRRDAEGQGADGVRRDPF